MVSATLGLSAPWQVNSVTVSAEGKRLDIVVSHEYFNSKACPWCGVERDRCKVITEIWYHHDFFRFTTYLHTRVPCVYCCDLIQPIERPWARAGSKFVRLSDGQ